MWAALEHPDDAAPYAPPEFYEGALSPHSDQYALAVTYCQLRTGQVPFATVDSEGKPRHQPSDLAVLIPPAAERAIVQRALATNPTDRWPSCEEFIAALIATSRDTDPKVRPDQKGDIPSHQPR